MYVCICNALTEKDVANMSIEEYNKIVKCGSCRDYIMKNNKGITHKYSLYEMSLETKKSKLIYEGSDIQYIMETYGNDDWFYEDNECYYCSTGTVLYIIEPN